MYTLRLSVRSSRNGCAHALGFVASHPQPPTCQRLVYSTRLWAATTLQRKMALRGWQDEAGRVAAGGVGGAAGGRGELRRVSFRCTRIITAMYYPALHAHELVYVRRLGNTGAQA